MKLLILTFSILFLSSCGMTNDEIISETKKCNDNGLFGLVQTWGDGSTPKRVICIQQ